ncbi:unnamed protein product [Phytophthora fragariaefolia]|uniref:Unnamed protein product n=1 Tax=Phytophthora fragariaefolia TaxID=1490495 RepID=A0A9W7D904_9STRA|nr:unnamed protein product [Phytophthora fragariaefolia]
MSSEMLKSLKHAFPSTRERSVKIDEEVISEPPEREDPKTDSRAVIDPVETFQSLHTLSARTVSASSEPSTDRGENTVSKQHYTRSTEVQIINNFFLMQKVFNETIKDISLLNRLGIERTNIMRKHLSEALALLAEKREREIEIEAKLAENMEFCVTACLNFAAIIDRILGAQRSRNKTQQPSIIQTNALLAVAEVTAELLSKKSVNVTRKKTAEAGESVPGVDGVHQKRTSFRNIDTLSKIFVGPILHKNDKSQKCAEFTNKKVQQKTHGRTT